MVDLFSKTLFLKRAKKFAQEQRGVGENKTTSLSAELVSAYFKATTSMNRASRPYALQSTGRSFPCNTRHVRLPLLPKTAE